MKQHDASSPESIDEMIARIKQLCPNIKVNRQPMTATRRLLALEKEHGINTADVLYLEGIEQKLDDGVLEEWITQYNTFMIHKGNVKDINHI